MYTCEAARWCEMRARTEFHWCTYTRRGFKILHRIPIISLLQLVGIQRTTYTRTYMLSARGVVLGAIRDPCSEYCVVFSSTRAHMWARNKYTLWSAPHCIRANNYIMRRRCAHIIIIRGLVCVRVFVCVCVFACHVCPAAVQSLTQYVRVYAI